jgi:ATP-dependent protease HslVU (ClpYQ) peptidase subunit
VQRSLDIAADICVFTNRNITILELPGDGKSVSGKQKT